MEFQRKINMFIKYKHISNPQKLKFVSYVWKKEFQSSNPIKIHKIKVSIILSVKGISKKN